MNKKIINEFERLVIQINYDMDNAETNVLKNKHLYRLRSIKNALSIIKKFKTEIKSGQDLKGIKSIGIGIINRIDEIIKNGYLSEIIVSTDNEKQINDLENVIGIGRKMAYNFVKLGITSVKLLKKAIKDNEIQVNDQIKLGLKYHNVYKTNIPRSEMNMINKYLQKICKNIDKDLECVLCGSYRRNSSTSNDIDVLLVHPNIRTIEQIKKSDNYLNKFVNTLLDKNIIVDNITTNTVSTKYMGFMKIKTDIRRIDIRFLPYPSYYSALLYFTGPGEFNRQMRSEAKAQGYKINEYGIYKLSKDGTSYKQMNVYSEHDIFNYIKKQYIEPPYRK
jgi:DNA polymerase beta